MDSFWLYSTKWILFAVFPNPMWSSNSRCQCRPLTLGLGSHYGPFVESSFASVRWFSVYVSYSFWLRFFWHRSSSLCSLQELCAWWRDIFGLVGRRVAVYSYWNIWRIPGLGLSLTKLKWQSRWANLLGCFSIGFINLLIKQTREDDPKRCVPPWVCVTFSHFVSWLSMWLILQKNVLSECVTWPLWLFDHFQCIRCFCWKWALWIKSKMVRWWVKLKCCPNLSIIV